jgi:hypothetical protein
MRTGRIDGLATTSVAQSGWRHSLRPQVLLAGGTAVEPATVVAATGFTRGLRELFADDTIVDAHEEPRGLNATPAADGLWFAGFAEPLEGPLRYIRLHAGPVAAAVAGHLSARPAAAPVLVHAS